MALWCRWILAGFLLLGSVYAQTPARRVILMLGPPGAGKTTQSEKLKSALGLPVLSATDVLQASATGAISDEAANSSMRKRISQKDCERGFILDGYPATAKQAAFFDSLLSDLGLPRPAVIHLSIPDVEADRRLAKRGGTGDTPANTERRIVEYRSQAELLLARYPNAVTVDGTKSPDAVAARIRAALGY